MSRSLQNDPIAQSIKRTVLQGHSDLRLAGGDAEERLVKHLHRAFRKRGEDLGAFALPRMGGHPCVLAWHNEIHCCILTTCLYCLALSCLEG